ncbi:hypothetical protein Tco_1456227 [Tanacetum coccineum]
MVAWFRGLDEGYQLIVCLWGNKQLNDVLRNTITLFKMVTGSINGIKYRKTSPNQFWEKGLVAMVDGLASALIDMSNSNTHHTIFLLDAGLRLRPSDAERGPYEFKEFTSSKTNPSRMQKEEDLKRDDLKHYEAKIEAINLILIFIPNDIYNSLDACTTTQAIWQREEALIKEVGKSYDPLALVAHTSSSFRTISLYYVTYPSSVVDYDEDYQGLQYKTLSDDHSYF